MKQICFYGSFTIVFKWIIIITGVANIEERFERTHLFCTNIFVQHKTHSRILITLRSKTLIGKKNIYIYIFF